MDGKRKGALREYERAFRLFDEFKLTVGEIEKEMKLVPGEGRQLIVKYWHMQKHKEDKWAL